MADKPQKQSTNKDESDISPGKDPTDTDHPTGEAQAAENAENEPAG